MGLLSHAFFVEPTRRLSDLEKILADRRKDIDQDDLLVHHRRTVAVVRRKVEDVPGRYDVLDALNKKFDPPFYDECHLFMRMRVFRGNEERVERESAHHDILTDDHLPFDARGRMGCGNFGPIGYESGKLNLIS